VSLLEDQQTPSLQVVAGGMVVLTLPEGEEKLFRLAEDGLYVWSKKRKKEICLPWSSVTKGLIERAANCRNGNREAVDRFLASVIRKVEQLNIE